MAATNGPAVTGKERRRARSREDDEDAAFGSRSFAGGKQGGRQTAAAKLGRGCKVHHACGRQYR